ncbi:conserved hypothetical protein [Candidatus Magnetomoraceae bacterium gMMP-15]
MNKFFRISFKEQGFTHTEVIVILIILSMISAIILGKLFSTSSYKIDTETEILKKHLAYAQYMAMKNPDNGWGINFEEKSYSLINYAGQVSDFPNDIDEIHKLAKNIIIKSDAGSTIYFDMSGCPFRELDEDRIPKALDDDMKIVISSSSNISNTLIITRNTGFITTQW